VDGPQVGTIYVDDRAEPSLAVRRRYLPALASLLAVALDRERLTQRAIEADTLKRSDIAKTAVLRAVSHDLRTPLTAIKMAADGLSNYELSEADRAALLVTIEDETGRLTRLVANLLDLSRLQAGAALPVAELWPPEALVSQAIASIGHRADRVQVQVSPDLSPVRVDSTHAQRVLVNLIENAVRYSPADEPVLVRATCTRSEVILRVVDHGPGIETDELERVFEPFFPNGQTPHGTGLGLAIARGFAEANGGRVWAESQPGQGASLAFALPVG
jgi:two-component system sensor histidine kinase KdpD